MLQQFAYKNKRSRFFELQPETTCDPPAIISDVSRAAQAHTQELKETIAAEIRSIHHLIRAPEPRPYVDGSHNTELKDFKIHVQGNRCNLCASLEGRRQQRLQLDHIFSRELLPLYATHGWPLPLLPTKPVWIGKELKNVSDVYNGTEHDPRNIQAICAACHDAKTERDRAAATKYRADIKERDRLRNYVGENAADTFWTSKYALPTEEDALLVLDQRRRTTIARANRKIA